MNITFIQDKLKAAESVCNILASEYVSREHRALLKSVLDDILAEIEITYGNTRELNEY